MSNDEAQDEINTAREELEGLLKPRYMIKNLLGKGGAGIVFQVTDIATDMDRVAKILRPSVRDLEDIKREFKREAHTLAHLRHQNLVTVFEQSKEDEIPYFVMEYLNGKSLDEAIAEIAQRNPGGAWVLDVRKITLKLADVLAYLHSQKPQLLHLDVKPENIILTQDYRGNPFPILLDFGISRFADSEDAKAGETPIRGTFPVWPKSYMHALKRMTNPGRTLFFIERGKVNASLDLHLLGRTLSIALEAGRKADPALDEWGSIANDEYKFLTEIIARLDIDQPKVPGYDSAFDLRLSIRRLDLRASRTRYYFDDGFVRIPGPSVRSFGGQARRLADLPIFQRLRGIHQLGLTYLVFPGATHTRFEHALGVFENAIDVLDQVSGQQGDYRFRSVVTDEELIGTAIVALYHDVGHYPFAHQFRVSGEFPRHEVRTLEVLEGDEVRGLITSIFNTDVYKATVDIFKCINAYEYPQKRAEDNRYPNHFRVLRAVISSTIDVDKLDYVNRDSHHAGVPYGVVVDRERFLTSLRVWWDQEGLPQLLLSDKGRVCAEALVFARYLLTSEVYWNHAVRAYAAMLTAAIGLFSTDEVHQHLWDTDSTFLRWLGNDKRSSWLVELIERRTPYRRAFVHQRLGGGDAAGETDQRLFEFLESAVKGQNDLIDSIREVVESALGVSGTEKHEIVFDVPAGMTRVRGVQVLPEGHEEPGRVGPIFDAIGDNFDGFARKARIFVHPRLMERKSVAESTTAVRKALLQEFQLI